MDAPARREEPSALREALTQQPQEPVETEATETAETTEQQHTDPGGTRFERARTALLRDGWKEDDFKGLSREQIIRRGLKRARAQDRQAAAFAENERLRRENDSLRKGQTATGTANGGAHSGAPSPSADPRLTELLAKHGLEADDPQLKGVLDAYLSPVLAENAELKRSASQRSQANGSDANQAARMQKVRAEMSKSFPDFGDDDDFLETANMVARIATPDELARAETDDGLLRHLFTRAARALDLEEVGERDRGAWSNGSASSGAMETSSVSSAAPRSVVAVREQWTPEQAKRAALDAFKARRQQGATLAGLRR